MTTKPSVESFLNKKWKKWKITPLKGDSGEREYSLIETPDKKLVLVQYNKDLNSLKNFIKIQNLFKAKKLFVPEIYHTNDGSQWQLIEYLGLLDLEKYFFKERNLTYHKKAIDQLFILQNQIQEHEINNKMTQEKYLTEMKLTLDQFQYKIPAEERAGLTMEFKNIIHNIFQIEFVPSHRDFHSRNLFIHHNQIYLIDFQDAGFNPLYYDLVSLICDSYIQYSKEEEENLLQYYSKKWSKPIDKKLFVLTYCQRGFKAIGNFLSFYNLRKQKSHLHYIQPTLLKLKNYLEELNEYPLFLNYINKVSKEK